MGIGRDNGVTEAHGILALCVPRSGGAVFTNSVFAATLWPTTAANDKNQLHTYFLFFMTMKGTQFHFPKSRNHIK